MCHRLIISLAVLTSGVCCLVAQEPPATKPRLDSHGDPLPPGAIARLATAAQRKTAEYPAVITDIGVTEDGKQFWTVGGNSFCQWDANTFELIEKQSGGFDQPIMRVPGTDDFIGEKALPLSPLAKPRSTTAAVKRALALERPLAVSPDGKVYLSQNQQQRELHLWSVAERKLLLTVADAGWDCRPVFAPDSQSFFVSMDESLGQSQLQQLAVADGKCIQNFPKETFGHLQALVTSHDGKRLFVYGAMGRVSVIDVATWNVISKQQANEFRLSPYISLATSRDGRYLAVSEAQDRHRSIRVLDAQRLTQLASWSQEEKTKHFPRGRCPMVFTVDSKRLITAECTALVWELPPVPPG